VTSVPANRARPSADELLAGLGVTPPEPTAAAPTAGEAGWEPPVPLSGGRRPPPFPVDALPGWVADQVAAVAEFTQTPPDLPAAVGLACLSAAAGGRAAVEVRGSWREPVNLYTVVAMPPGSRKSTVFAAMTAPLLDAERGMIEQARAQIVEAELARRVAERAAEKAAQTAAAAAAGPQRDATLAEASTAAMTAASIGVPVLPRLVADDFTPEASASLLAEQGGRLAVLSAEATTRTTTHRGDPSLGL
jgi:replicative DNA helicase